MYQKEEINQRLAELASEFNTETLEMDQNNHCSINIENETNIDICWNDSMHMLIFSVSLGNINTEDKGLLREALESNYLWNRSFGTTLSLNKDNNSLWMIDRAPLEYFQQTDEFIAYIQHLINGAKYWQEKLTHPLTSMNEHRETEKQDAYFSPAMNLNHIKI